MSRRNRPQPEHRNPHELRLWAIVDSLVTDSSQKAAYLAFARELAVAERSSSFVRRATMRKPGTVEGGHVPGATRVTRRGCVPSACVELGAVQSPFSQRTKRVVQKYFGRGLSGHLMWLIGEAVLGKARITKLE
jgi:hypothetical protein